MSVKVYVVNNPLAINFLVDDDIDGFKEYLEAEEFLDFGEPEVFDIKPIPGIEDKIKAMLDKYSAETLDIEDVEFEDADLEEDELFAPYNDEDLGEETSLL